MPSITSRMSAASSQDPSRKMPVSFLCYRYSYYSTRNPVSGWGVQGGWKCNKNAQCCGNEGFLPHTPSSCIPPGHSASLGHRRLLRKSICNEQWKGLKVPDLRGNIAWRPCHPSHRFLGPVTLQRSAQDS